MKKIILGILTLILGVVITFSFTEKSSKVNIDNTDYKILQKWELPKVLNEVSGIAWIGGDLIACIQDEDGQIFIYNLKTSKLVDEISFGGGGDYEGIAVVEDDAYVLRSDGVIFKISKFLSQNPQVRKHVTEINQLPGIEIEGICADPQKNRLLLAVKNRKDSPEQKEVYSVNLSPENSEDKLLFTIDFSDPIFKNIKGKQKFMPGEIAIHPQTGEFYILDGSKPKILITEKDGTSKELLMLRLQDFGNPEGLTFSPEGDLYISNEAEDDPQNILKVALNRKTE